MRLLQARRLLNKLGEHQEEWRCGRARILLTGRDAYPRFDRRLELFFDLPPERTDPKKIARLLRLLDRLARGKAWQSLRDLWPPRRRAFSISPTTGKRLRARLPDI